MRTEGGKGVVHTKLLTRQSLRSTKLKVAHCLNNRKKEHLRAVRRLPCRVCCRRIVEANVLDASKSGQGDEKFQGVRVEDAAWSVLDAPKSGQSDERIQWCV